MNKYKVYCEVHGWVHVISASEPTVCPIDSNDQLRNSSSIIIESDIKTHDSPDDYIELSIEDHRTLKMNAIDIKTGQLIDLGYVFAGKVFSLSANAQTNILALDNTRDDPALTYPISYNTISDIDVFMIPDSATLHGMYLTALATKKARLDSGTQLKEQVRLAQTHEEIDQIIDNR